jgi:hypothetical protein
MLIFGREPVLWLGTLRAIVVCVTAFGLQLTVEQVAAVYLVSEAVTSLVARQNVTPTGTADRL